MIRKLFSTEDNRTLTFLRVLAGCAMLPHAAEKLLGTFGGPGYTNSMAMFAQMGIPAPLAALAIYTEFFASLGLIFGFLGRIASLGLIIIMAVAVATVHLPNGFFMNWAGTQAGEGFEYHILFVGLVAPIMISGAGAWSVDRLIAQWMSHESTEQRADRLRHAHAH
jgi:putative oxidoreductase